MKEDLVTGLHHLVDVNKMVKIGSCTSRNVDDISPTCYDDHFPGVSRMVGLGSHGSSAPEHLADVGKMIGSLRRRPYVPGFLDVSESRRL